MDDECAWREVLRVIFKDEYDLLLAGDGSTAIELAKQHDIDVTVTCLKMPRMDGLQLLERLKLLKPDIEVIVFTGLEDADFIRLALRHGACDYILKSDCLKSDYATIHSAVSKAMQHRKLESEKTIARKKSNSNAEKVENQTPFKRRGRLLIVDDEEAIREIIREIFKDDYDLLLAEDGPTAIELAQKYPIDVVVLDIYMAGMSGIDALERLKFVNPDIEVIMTTGMETTDTMLQALRLGACDYISTPFDMATIRSAVSKAMHIGHGDNPSREVLNKSEAETPPVVSDAELETWFQKGERYFAGKDVPQDYVEAVKWFRMAAEKGHLLSQYKLGCCYDFGNGVRKNQVEAARWYYKAAEQGFSGAQFMVGHCLMTGEGIPQDQTEAVEWYRKSAEQDFSPAQVSLAMCYRHGRGVPKNVAEAANWYHKAAEQGDADAQLSLAGCCKTG